MHSKGIMENIFFLHKLHKDIIKMVWYGQTSLFVFP